MWVRKKAWERLESRLTALEDRARQDPQALIEQALDANVNAANALDRANALAARMAKRDKQLLEDLRPPPENGEGAPVALSKEDYRRIAHQRGLI